MGQVDARLQQLELELPQPSKPGANYVPYVRSGDLVFLTGQLSQWNGERRFVGKLGREFGVPEGQQAARLCALNLWRISAPRSTVIWIGLCASYDWRAT
jgi:hypothetical protein